MKAYHLPADLRIRLWIVKAVALLGGFFLVWQMVYRGEGYDAMLHGPLWLPWAVLVAFLVINAFILRFFSMQPERQERVYLFSLFADLAGAAFLAYCLAQFREMPVLLLCGLIMITGFFNFVLPRSGGVLVSIMCVMLYILSIFPPLALMDRTEGAEIRPMEVVGLLLFGMGVIIATSMLTRRIKRGIDEVYTEGSALTTDLSRLLIDAELGNEEIAEDNRETQTLLQLLQNITSVLEWDELFDRISSSLRNRFDYTNFTVYLLNGETGQLDLTVLRGRQQGYQTDECLNPEEGVVGWCFTTSKGALIEDLQSDPRFDGKRTNRRISSAICQPLVFRGERLGVMCLDSERAANFDEDGFRFLESLAPLVAIAVSNSLSYNLVKEESNTDNLTGLSNHRGFMDTFLTTLEVALTNEIPLALLIIDIDDFKKVNDTYGHLVGNLILIELASILRSFFRGTDIVARYGGEEFVILMRGTKPDVAPRISEQLRRKVANHQFPISLNRDAFKQVTVSLGLATSMDSNLKPERHEGSRASDDDMYITNINELAEQIIDNADQALYVAKREGKDQVRLTLEYPLSQEPQPAVEIKPES